MNDPQALTILHLSDPQFGRNHRFVSFAPDDPDAQFETLFQRLSDDLSILEKKGVKPQVVVVSGDLAEWAKKQEFEDAFQFLCKLSDRLSLPHGRFVIVPGNHDINRNLCEAYFKECEGDDLLPQEPYVPKWKHYIGLFNQFYKDEKGISFTPVEPWTLWELEDLKLVVAGLNSTMKESHKDGSHYGWVGEAQCRWFASRVEPYQGQGWFRLGVVHHNVQRGAKDDDENLKDADTLEQWLAPSLNLLLHGHTHSSKLGGLGRDLPVLSTGSAALKKDVRPDEVPNQYQAIRIWPDHIERWTRRYDPQKKRWIGDTSCSPEGDKWEIQEKVSFKSVHCIFPIASAKAHFRPEDEAFERRWHKLLDPVQDLVARAAEVARLRYRGAEVDVLRSAGAGLDYLRVRMVDGSMVRISPIGVSEHGISDEQIERFNREIIAPYRTLDRTLPCEIVYGGDRAEDGLIRKAATFGIRLVSFVEFQGIVDFRGYVQRQTQKLESSQIYPPKLYVAQRVIYEIGRDRHESPDACAEIMDWLKEPLGRFVLVLGDFGAGKTFLLHEVARRMTSEIPHMVPVLIELRNLEKARTMEELIAQHLTGAGERYLDLEAFPYMLREGRIALLFDGFDELVLRVSYQRATEHLETLLQAAAGRAKVVVSSRTQHFESDEQVKTALFQRTETLPGLRVARVQLFDESQILNFLVKLLEGDQERARQRFTLIKDIQDLLGLSHNPRMLSFIAALPEQELREAQERTGKITSAELYRLLIDRWLTFEYERAQPKGAPPTLTVAERWHAVTAVALCLWPKIDRTMRLSELTEEVSDAVDKLTEKPDKQLDLHTAAHLVGSGTLLVRDESGAFAFVHQSVMEWLVANRAAGEIKSGATPAVLALREMSPLMADFFCDLAGRETALEWARSTVSKAEDDQPFAKSNASLVLERLGEKTVSNVRMAEADLRGKSFSGQNLQGADFTGADLTETRFEGSDLRDANLSNAVLENADLTRADLRSAKLREVKASGATFLGTDLRDGVLAGADMRRAKLVGARLSQSGLTHCNIFGAAEPRPEAPQPMVSWSSPVTSVAIGLHDIVASGHSDGLIRLWDAGSGKELRVLRGHENLVMSVAFSPDGERLASGSYDKTVRLWDAGSGKELRVLRGHENLVTSVAFSPDGERLASGSYDKTVRLWDAGNGKELRVLRGHDDWVMSVAFSPDGERLASGGDDKTVRLWEAGNGKELRVLRGHENLVMSVAFSPDGERLASGSYDKTVRLWDAGSGKELRVLRGHDDWVRSVAFSPDGRRLASGGDDKTVRLWDAGNGRELQVLRGHENGVTSVAFSPDGRRLASGGDDKTVRLWDAGNGNELRVLRGHENGVTSVAFSPDGERLASGGYDKTVRLWDAGSGKELRVLRGHENLVTSVAFSPDGERLASGSCDKTVRRWDAGSGNELRVLRGHENLVMSVAFSPDGRRLASGSYDKTVRLWDAGNGRELRVLRGHDDWVRSVAFSPDGRRLASGGDDKTVRLWDAGNGRELRVLRGHENLVMSVAFSPDGRRLASGGDKTVRLWDAGSGKELRVLRGHDDWVRSVAFSPDGRRLASGGDDKTVRLWDAGNGRELQVLRGHENGVTSVAFSPDGQRLASGGSDTTVRLWDAGSGKLLATLVPTAEGWAAFTPDGRYKISGDLGGAFWYAINLCRFEPGELDAFLPPGTLRRLELDEPLW
jgi:WD40 repeat protein/3',5'-cyclic AMP phosphodiesterase CpdA